MTARLLEKIDMRVCILIMLWVVTWLTAGAATQSVMVTYDDHTSRTFSYLDKTKSNLIVQIYGKPVLLPLTNIISLEIKSTDRPTIDEIVTNSVTEESSAQKGWLSRMNVAIERWALTGFSFLFFCRALWRFRREGDFYSHGIAFGIYLGLMGLLIVVGIAGWGGAGRQMAGLGLVLLFGQFYTNRDLAERRSGLYFWLAMVTLSALVGAGFGYLIWNQSGGKIISPGAAVIIGALLTSALPFYQLTKYLNVSVGDFLGGLRADMIFSEGVFAEKFVPRKHIPSERLLLHWRENGLTKKAWRTARAHLRDEPEAFPIWMFAMETAALHLKKPAAAKSILKRVLKCKSFSTDFQSVAVTTMRDLAMMGGFDFHEKEFRDKLVRARKQSPLAKVMELREKGRFAEAEKLLLSLIENDPENAAIFTQLVRLYAEDLKQRTKALQWITKAEGHLPTYHVDFLRNSLEEWITTDNIIAKRSSGRMPWRRQLQTPGKLVLNSLTGATASVAGSVEDCLERRQINPTQINTFGKPAQPSRDKVDELVTDRRYGTAVELLKKELVAQPGNFDLWMRYAEVHGYYCGDVNGAKRIVEQMEQLQVFSSKQMQTASTKLKSWRDQHPVRLSGW